MRRSLLTVCLLGVLGCQQIPPRPPYREALAAGLDADQRLVLELLAWRAASNPHERRGAPDLEILAFDHQGCELRPWGSQEPGRRLAFADLGAVRVQDRAEGGHLCTVYLHLRPGSASAEALQASRDLQVWLGLDDPYLVLSERDARQLPTFRRALRRLAAGAAP